MMVEYGEEFWGSRWDSLYGFLGGNPLAAMPSLHFATSVMAAHLLAETGPVAGALGWAYAGTLGVALVYLGEHYVVDLAAGLALAEGVRARGAGGRRRCVARVSARRPGAGGAGARMTEAERDRASQDPRVNPQPPRGRATRTVRRSRSRGATSLVLGAFLLASLAALYFLLPQLAGLDETWNRIEDGRPAWIAAALLFTLGMFAGYVGDVPRRLRPRRRLAHRLGRELPDHDGGARRLAPVRGRRRRRARADGVGAAPRGHAPSAPSPTRRSPSSSSPTCPTASRSSSAASACTGGCSSGSDPFSLTFVPAVVARGAAGARAGDRAHPDRPAAAAARRSPHARAGSARLAQQLAAAPAATSAGVRDALEHLRSRDPALLGAVLFWAFQIAVLWAAFHAFGDAPPLAVLVQAFFVGHARQPAADAGRRRRRRGRDDRRLRRLRRRRRPGRRRGARLPRVHVLAAAAAGRHRLLPAAPHGRALEARASRVGRALERLHYTK